MLLQEMTHDARIVPIDGKPAPADERAAVHGDPRGRWEGDTLVVETTNYIGRVHGLDAGREGHRAVTPASSEDFINWEITVDDPKTWTQPWSFMVRLKKDRRSDLRIRVPRGQLRDDGILAAPASRKPRKPQSTRRKSRTRQDRIAT